MTTPEERDYIGEVIREDEEARRAMHYKPAESVVLVSPQGSAFVPIDDYNELRQQLADVSHDRDLLRAALINTQATLPHLRSLEPSSVRSLLRMNAKALGTSEVKS